MEGKSESSHNQNVSRRDCSSQDEQNESNLGSELPEMRPDVSTKSKDGPEDLDFGNPRGIIITIIMMPCLVFTLNAACDKSACTILTWPRFPTELSSYLDTSSMKLYAAWLVFHAVAYWAVPGNILMGQPTPSGKRLLYKCNGFSVLLVVVVSLTLAWVYGIHITWLYDHLFGLMMTSTAVAFAASMYLYYRATSAPDRELSSCGNTGYPLYDFYLGRELNPRLGDLDLKFLCELRPGLIGWLVLDLVFLARAVEVTGSVNLTQILITLGHGLYVVDALYFEESVLTTMDITREGFGFMLVFGDLVWVPFLFSLQARFLLEHPQYWSYSWTACIITLNMIGYWIFRASNNEKDMFRRYSSHPHFKGRRMLTGATGKSLLVDGWWGMCRHPNYLGDIIMAFSWALLCGMSGVLPWFYVLYLVGTLIHRAGRDDKWCRQKYGETWKTYCSLVPYKIIPGLF